MPIFRGMPSGANFNFDKKQDSVMCAVCIRKFKEYMNNGGEKPTPCVVCQERLKSKMHGGMHPDR